MKAHHRWIIPLCHSHHHELDTGGRRTFESTYAIDLEGAARKTHASLENEIAGESDLDY